MFNDCLVSLKFQVGKINNTCMRISIDDTSVEPDSDILVFPLRVVLPKELIITVSGKGPKDTIVDADGNILADKYLKLVDISIDGLSAAPYYVNKIMFYPEQGGEIMTNYWGFNGTAKLDLLYDNAFYWSIHTANAVK